MSNCCEKYKATLLEEWNTYTNDYEDSPEVNALKRQYLDSALAIVEEYLGYKLGKERHIEEHTGIYGRDVYTNTFPIIECFSFSVNGRTILPQYLTVMGDHISMVCNPNEYPFHADDSIVIEYSAGYDNLPIIVKQTIFRIATLLKTEANGNIGITSKSYGDNSRSFLNFTSFEKYLSPLSRMRRGILA